MRNFVELTKDFLCDVVFVAMQTFYLRIWAEEDVGPFIQALHFGISLGGVVTPLISK